MFDDEKSLSSFNWGAFWLCPLWGIAHGVYFALLALVPISIVQFVVMIFMGIKGNEMAYDAYLKSGNTDPKAFIKAQNTWNRAGVVYMFFQIGAILFAGIWFFTGLFSLFD